jgi:phosphoglycerate dehydrogenase-like enzyme
LPNVVLTPHIGASTVDAQREIGRRILEIVGTFALGNGHTSSFSTLNSQVADNALDNALVGALCGTVEEYTRSL